MGSNSSNAVLSLFLLLQLGGALVFVLGGLYVLYCFNRASTGIERMADAAEAWLALQHYQAARAAQTTTDGAPTIAMPQQQPRPTTAPDAPAQEPPVTPQNF